MKKTDSNGRRPWQLRWTQLHIVSLLLCVGACQGPALTPGDSGPAVVPDAVWRAAEPQPQDEPLTASGNSRQYVVNGVQYSRLDTAVGYKEDGIASWYGNKFHGRTTASGERYDMYALTAAHRSLPLPTFVRVTNLRNDRSLVVRVNDRGPFIPGRLIDLSYAAAARLGILQAGTARVRVESLSMTPVERTALRREIERARRERERLLAAKQAEERAAAEAAARARAVGGLQIAAFGEYDGARRLRDRVAETVAEPVFIVKHPDRELYRVRVGPFETSARRAAVDGMLRKQLSLDPINVADP
ncbi:MAG: septal ring lytic transglycosylase RlpA family protein [Pseudomonadota bacterium]